MLFQAAVVPQSLHSQEGRVIGFSIQKLRWQFLIFEVYGWDWGRKQIRNAS